MKIFVVTQAIPEYDCYQSPSPYDSGYYVMGAFSTYDLAKQALERLERVSDGLDYFAIHSVHVDDFLSIETMEEDYKRQIGDDE